MPSKNPILNQQLLEIEKIAIQNSFSSFLHRSFISLNNSSNYLNNWHLEAIIEHLQAVENGSIKRLIINIPPRYLKSLTVSVAWCAWLLGQNPARRIIVASYAERLSIKHSLDCRLIINEDWYKRAYPNLQILTG